jgi:hypothetical protein
MVRRGQLPDRGSADGLDQRASGYSATGRSYRDRVWSSALQQSKRGDLAPTECGSVQRLEGTTVSPAHDLQRLFALRGRRQTESLTSKKLISTFCGAPRYPTWPR